MSLISEISILILAAGASKRMGTTKQLLPWKHTTLLGNTVEEALKTSVETVYVVIGANEVEIRKEVKKHHVEILFNVNWDQGLGTTIAFGMNHLLQLTKPPEAVLVLLADQPFLNCDYMERMLNSFRRNKITATAYPNGNGVPAIFPKKYFSELIQLKGDKGAKTLLNNSEVNVITPPIDLLTDIDTMEVYRRCKG